MLGWPINKSVLGWRINKSMLGWLMSPQYDDWFYSKLIRLDVRTYMLGGVHMGFWCVWHDGEAGDGPVPIFQRKKKNISALG